MALLEVSGLDVWFGSGPDAVHAVDNVSLDLSPGETLAIVGESGSGKSVTALAIMRLLTTADARVSGDIMLGGRDVSALRGRQLREFRGGRVAMVYQDPMTSMNPAMTVGSQIVEPVKARTRRSRADLRALAADLLARVRVSDPQRRAREYPHRLSGGMRQRAMIAMALAGEPQVILADEITTALDVTVQAQVLDVLRDVIDQTQAAAMLITHNLAVVAGIADRVQVMYAGQVVERASTADLFERPMMPYTWALLGSTPRLDQPRPRRLVPIAGEPPDPRSRPLGCRFAPRCPFSQEICHRETPQLLPVDGAGPGHVARCWGVQPGVGTGWLTEHAAGRRWAAEGGA